MMVDASYLHTVAWIAEKTGRKYITVHSWVRRGKLKSVMIDGIPMVCEMDFPDWLNIMINDHESSRNKNTEEDFGNEGAVHGNYNDD